MSRGINNCTFIGHLGSDPEHFKTSTGELYLRCNIAVNKKRGDKEETNWVPLVFFGKLAEIVKEFYKKGDMIYVCGEISIKQRQTQSGETYNGFSILVRESVRLKSKENTQSTEENKPGIQAPPTPVMNTQQTSTYGALNKEQFNINDEIPF